ncbi:phage protein Gp27 family protein [Humitalea sp. 24SJ18S-53]|uniref:phage protein Gp27 family protein n=1 Tax=Humitalea sp. 24SJ18S-53 TaxID=3422307 RepID=UPI003D67D906
MPRPSSVQKLPEEVRGLIGALRENGRTLDEILAKLREMLADDDVPSRSALGRHIKGMAHLGERMRKAREISESLRQKLGVGEERTAALNIELLHAAVLDIFLDADEGEPVSLEKMGELAKIVRALATARKADADTTLKIRTAALADAAKAAEGAGKAAGLTAATIETIKARIMGVKAG